MVLFGGNMVQDFYPESKNSLSNSGRNILSTHFQFNHIIKYMSENKTSLDQARFILIQIMTFKKLVSYPVIIERILKYASPINSNVISWVVFIY